ncbi:hypothetical protein [Polaromonas sp. YR568]|uniref:hypothetical protein n=1 Tax=Polaromonas sp. YR568 TaxID=1855301 RepID=UPI00398BD321
MPAIPNSTSPLAGDPTPPQTGHADSAAREQRYKTLVDKIAAHRQGTGPAPTAAELEQCEEDAAFTQAMGRLLAGTSLPG